MQLLMERNRPEEEKREETWHRLKRDIASSADTIHEIDTGKARGYNRALFVSSIFNKVSTFAGHGEVEIVQRAIDFISEYNAGVKSLSSHHDTVSSSSLKRPDGCGKN